MNTLKKILCCVGLLAGPATVLGQVTVKEPVPPLATLEVNAAQVRHEEIPRTLFGSFLEPIGNSTYNGLWAEILENPSFEADLWAAGKVADMIHQRPELKKASDLGLPLPWEPLNGADGNRYEIRAGDAANSWQSLAVYAVPGKPTGIRQKVFLPVHRTGDYQGSFYARHISGSSKITVSLRTHGAGEVLAAQTLEAPGSTWQKFEFSLKIPAGRLQRLDPADFAIELDGDERVELDQVSLMPADAIDGLDPDEVSLARQMHTPLVRFGGNFTSAYHWTDGIGPRDKRRSLRNNSWGIPEYNSFGTDEFLAFCRLIGAQPQIALNLGSGTPEEAAAWVRYVDEHWTPHSGLLWELGNELWGNWNLGYPVRSQLAQRTLDFATAVRAADPAARLIATGQDPDNFHDWDAIQLSNPPGTFDYLSTHFVVQTGDAKLPHPSADFTRAAALALPVELERRLHAQQQQIDAVKGYAGKVHIAFTEWLFISQRPDAAVYSNTGGALITGGFLNMLLRNSALVPISDMTGIMEFAGIWKKRSQVYGTPAYHVFKMYSGADADHLVQATTRSGSYSVSQGIGRLPEIGAVPYLDVVAALSKDGHTLTLFCLNRSLDSDIRSQVRVSGFAAREAKIAVLTAKDLNDGNDEVEPERVVAMASSESVPASGWTHVFPRASVSVIALQHR